MANGNLNRFSPSLSPETPPDVAQAIRFAFNALQDHYEAFRALKGQAPSPTPPIPGPPGPAGATGTVPPIVLVAGVCDGVNTAFTLPTFPLNPATVMLYKRIVNFGAVLLIQDVGQGGGVDYTLVGNAITWTDATTLPQTGDALYASYT